MPLLIVAIALVAVAILFLAFFPLILFQRYRVGTMRQPARGWLLTLNVVGIGLSALLFVIGAAVTTIWVPGAFAYSMAGLASGGILAIAGLRLTRWELLPNGLFFTPNRWLVLTIMIAVTGRLMYGAWRAWEASRSFYDGAEWAAAAGIPQSMAAGGLALGYYLVYWAGVRKRLGSHRRAG